MRHRVKVLQWERPRLQKDLQVGKYGGPGILRSRMIWLQGGWRLQHTSGHGHLRPCWRQRCQCAPGAWCSWACVASHQRSSLGSLGFGGACLSSQASTCNHYWPSETLWNTHQLADNRQSCQSTSPQYHVHSQALGLDPNPNAALEEEVMQEVEEMLKKCDGMTWLSGLPENNWQSVFNLNLGLLLI